MLSPEHGPRRPAAAPSHGLLEIQCENSTCKLVETGGYLDPDGNDFWGVEAFVRDGQTYILGSDRDSGLWIFRQKP